MKTVKINGTTYTVKKAEPYFNGKTSIFDLYDRPSTTKVVIFREWQEKLNSIYGLVGNSCTFSIYWDVIDENGVKHDVRITHANNYILN